MFTFELNIGDVSGDGHERYRTYFVQTSHQREHISKAFKLGQEKLGVDFTKLCSKYEESYILLSEYEKFERAGFKYIYSDQYVDKTKSTIDVTDFFHELVAFTIKVGNPDIYFEFADIPTLSLGNIGYGLFY